MNWSAHHEAGHAVVASLLGLKLLYVTCRPSAGMAGHARYWPTEEIPTDATLEKAIQVSYAGALAEDRAHRGVLRHDYWTARSAADWFTDANGARTDRETVAELSRLLANDDEELAKITRTKLRGYLLNLTDREYFWPAVERVADALATERILVDGEVGRLVEAARQQARGTSDVVSLKGRRLQTLKRNSAALVRELATLTEIVTPPPPRPDLRLVAERR